MYCKIVMGSIQRINGDHQPKNDCLTPITPHKCNFLGNGALLNGRSIENPVAKVVIDPWAACYGGLFLNEVEVIVTLFCLKT